MYAALARKIRPTTPSAVHVHVPIVPPGRQTRHLARDARAAGIAAFPVLA